MPLGDSITLGSFVPGGYRAPLYHMLTNAGYTFEFVGSLSNGASGLADPRHEGHSGCRIEQIDAGFCAWANALPEPDLILLQIGVNDFAQNQELTSATNRLDHLITRITSLRPAAKLIVADLFLRDDYPDVGKMIQTTYNPFVPGIVARHAARGEQVYFLPLNSALEKSDLAEGLHPNETGYKKLAACWFRAITNLAAPWGTTNSPVIANVTGERGWTNVVVSFSKPVASAAATNPANYSLSGGLRILSAAFAPASLRDVRLTTTPQIPSCTYQVSVSNICDLTPSHRMIAPGSTAAFLSAVTSGAFNNAPEATNYTLVYSLSVPNFASYNSTPVPYEVDNHRAIRGFSRIAYYLELQRGEDSPQFVWVSMDAFTDDPAKIGVPAAGTRAFFQQHVTNMNVVSSVRGVVNGRGLQGGYLEFWPLAYSANNAANVTNASSLIYDFSDQARVGDCGSMQVHNIEAAQTVFAFNHWATGKAIGIDLGIGNGPGANPDWTFSHNASNYTRKTLQVFVQPANSTNSANSL